MGKSTLERYLEKKKLKEEEEKEREKTSSKIPLPSLSEARLSVSADKLHIPESMREKSDPFSVSSTEKGTLERYRTKKSSQEVTAKLKTWYDEYSSYVSDYQSRTAGLTGTYNDSYSSGTSEWLADLTTRKNHLDKEADEIRGLLEITRDVYGDKWTDAALVGLDMGRKTQEEILGGASSYNKYWSQWESEDKYNEWATYMRDREEKLSYDLEAGAREIKQLENRLATVPFVKRPFSPIYEELNSKKAYYNLAEQLQAYESLKDQAISSPNFKSYAALGESDPRNINITKGVKDDKYAGRYQGMAQFAANEDWLDHMTDEQREIYNYHVFADSQNGTNNAEKFLDLVEKGAQSAMYNKAYEKFDDSALGAVFYNAAANVASAFTGIEAFLSEDGSARHSGLAESITAASENESLKDIDLKYYNIIDKEWKDTDILGKSLGQVASEGVGTVAHMLPSKLASSLASFMGGPTVGRVVGSGMLGLSAAGAAKQQMLDLGYSKEQATAYGALVGASETLLEYAFSGISAIGGKAWDALGKTKLISKLDNVLGNISVKAPSALVALGKTVGGMAGEAFEEGLQTIIEPWLESVVLGGDYEAPDWEEVAYSSLLGALSAAGLEGIGASVNVRQTAKTGREIQNIEGGIQKLVDTGHSYSVDTVAHKLAGKIEAAINEGKKVNAYSIGKLFIEEGATLSEQNKNDIKRGLAEMNWDENSANIMTETYARFLDESIELSQEAIDIFTENAPFTRAVINKLIGENTTTYQRQKGYVDLERMVNGDTSGNTSAKTETKTTPEFDDATVEAIKRVKADIESDRRLLSADRSRKIAAEANKASAEDLARNALKVEGKYTSHGTGVTRLKNTHEKVSITDVVSTKDGNVRVRLNNNKVVDLAELDLASESDAVLYEAVARMGVDAGAAKLIVNGYDSGSGVSAEAYALGMAEAINNGKYNIKQISNNGFAAMLNPIRQKHGRDIGRMSAEATARAEQDAVNAKVAKAKAEGKAKQVGGISYDASVDTESLTDTQKAQISILEKVVLSLGVKVKLFASSVANEGGKRGFTTEDGQFTRANGWYDPETGDIWVDVNAGADGKGLILVTAAHELTHFIRQWSPAKYKIFADFIISQYGEGSKTVNELVKERQDVAVERGYTLSYDEALEEVVARSCESFLQDSDAAVKIAALAQKDKSLAQKIKSFVGQLLAKIRRIAKELGLAPDSEEGKYIASMETGLQSLYDMWTDALIDAGRSFSRAGVAVDGNTESASPAFSERTRSASEYKISTSMTMAEAKRMIETAYKVHNIAEYYEGEYTDAHDWLVKAGSREVEMYIENDYDLQAKYINSNEDILNEEYTISDVLDAYLAGTLVGKEKPKPKRLDVSQSTKLQDNRFYSPQKIEDAKATFELANQKAVGKDANAINRARAEILLFAHNKGAAELLGVTQAELNKKLRGWSRYSATAKNISERINAGVAEENRWTGIENSAYINKAKVTDEDIERLVASVEGDSKGYERKYIARVMLAADTHIDYSGLKFKFASSQQVNADNASGGRVLGFYDDTNRLIEVTHDKPHTVAHEMGHYLDAQWGRDLIGASHSHLFLTMGINADMVRERYGEPGVQFLNNFKLFINSLADVNQANNSYYNDRKEIFARFFARFIEWTDNIATGNRYYSYESTMYNDKFTQAQYVEFARLLQEKALLDGTVPATKADPNKVEPSAKPEIMRSIKYANGEAVVWIEDDVLKGNKLPTHQAVANYLVQHIGEVYTIIESGQKVYLGKDLPSEYTQSEYTKRLLKRPSLLKAKNKALPNLGEMIEIATNRRWSKDKGSGKKDAKYGVYKYDTRFAFSIYDSQGNKVRAKAYDATLIIINSSDGKKYLYDLTEIKENTSVSVNLSEREAMPAEAGQKESVSNTIISHSDGSVNSKSKKMSERDSDYMDAVNRGDIETAQKMVDEAAKEAGYTPVTRYHQTGVKFNEFSNERPDAALNDSDTPNGFFFKENDHDIGVGADFVKTGHGGGIQMRVYLKHNNMLYFKNRDEAREWYSNNVPGYRELLKKYDTHLSDFEKIDSENNKKMFDELIALEESGQSTTEKDLAIMEKYDKIMDEWIKNRQEYETSLRAGMRDLLNEYFIKNDSGYDGIELADDGHRYIDMKREDVHTFIVFKNTQIKSADPVTYDDNGNVIPLSERFNTKNPDIRYSEREDNVTEREILADTLMGAAANDIEKNKLKAYKAKVKEMEAEQEKLGKIKAQIKELSFAKGERDTEKIKRLRELAVKTENRINIYDRQLLSLEATKPMRDLLERRVAEVGAREKAKATEKAKAQLSAVREQRDLKLAQQKAAFYDQKMRAAERHDKTTMRNKIRERVDSLNKLLLNPTKEKHIPMNLQKPVAELLSIINMESSDNEKVKAKLQVLKAEYEAIAKSEDPVIAAGYHPEVAERIGNVAEVVGDTALKDMNLEQLDYLYETLTIVENVVRNANKGFKIAKGKTITDYGLNVMQEILEVGGKEHMSNDKLDAISRFKWANLKPVYAFERIGSDTFTELFNNVRAGEDTWATDVSEARAFFLEKAKKYKYFDWDLEKTQEFSGKFGKKFELTLPQMMSLYAYSKRKQADFHLEDGGFVFEKAVKVKKKKHGVPIEYTVKVADPFSLRKEHLAVIVASLTDAQRAFVDEMQTYLSSVMGAKGNEVAREMYGIDLFKETDYFPLKSSSYYLAYNPEKDAQSKVKNYGMAKETVKNANNPIILSDFMDVWGKHVDEMSMYHAFVLPMEDFSKVFNFNTPTKDDGGNKASVQSRLTNAYGDEAVQYIKNLLTDLNGGARSDPNLGIINRLVGMFKKAKVFLSASVVIQQPSSIGRAFAVINPKYFTPNIKQKHGDAWNELKKYAPIATIKEMGYFDTNVGQSTVDYITGRDYNTLTEKIKGIATDKNYRDEAMGKLPAIADEMAWLQIWNAAKNEIADTTDLKRGTEEFLNAAGKRFTEAVVKTQVYDSVLSRSAWMRSKDGLSKMLTSFLAEPTTTANMMSNAVLQASRGNKKHFAATLGAVMTSIVMNSMLVSLVYAARDDDEDEAFTEKYVESLVTELIEGVNPATYLPIVKDIWSLLQGYDVERSDMSLISDLIDAIYGMLDDNKDWEEKIERLAVTLADMSGVPLNNVVKDIRAAFRFGSALFDDIKPTDIGMEGAIKDAVIDSVPFLDKFIKSASKSDKLYKAITSGSEEDLERAESAYKTDTSLETAIKKGLRENDLRVKKAALALYSGDTRAFGEYVKGIAAESNFDSETVEAAVRAEASAYETKIEGASAALEDGDQEAYKDLIRELRKAYKGILSQDEIVKAISEYEKPAEEAEDGFEEVESIYKTSDINTALESGDTDHALEIVKEILEVKVENNLAKARLEAEKSGNRFVEKKALKEAQTAANASVRSSLTSYWKKRYLEAFKAKDYAETERIRRLLHSTGVYGKLSELDADLKEWRKNN